MSIRSQLSDVRETLPEGVTLVAVSKTHAPALIEEAYAAGQRGQAIILTGDKPAVFIKDGLHSKFVMLKEQVLFGGSVVGVLRA